MPEKDAQEIKSCDICPKKLEILEKQGSRLGQKDCKNVCGGRARMICKQCTDMPGKNKYSVNCV